MPNPLSASPLQVWAAEDTSIQLTWGALPAGPVVAWAGESHANIDHRGGPGALDLAGLHPATDYTIDLRHGGGRDQLRVRTLPTPEGRPLCRVATVSDLHLGSSNWGASKLMLDRSGHPVPFAVRCARAAITEAIEWGADALIVKGDAAHHQLDEHFAILGDLLDEFDDLPVLLIPGNHEVDGRGEAPVPSEIGRRRVPFVRSTAAMDQPGIRLIVADTTVPGRGSGSLTRVADEIVELAADSPGPCLVGLHHQLQQHRVPTYYPPGIPQLEATPFLERLAGANPEALVTSGHTHRNRSRRHGPLAITEVASARDWPGVWAGYAVHEFGIRQVIRRASAPGAISWHEYSRRALLGVWGRWAPGPIEQRCFTHRWLGRG